MNNSMFGTDGKQSNNVLGNVALGEVWCTQCIVLYMLYSAIYV